MCRPGNQSIYTDCKLKILKKLKKNHARIREMRAVLLEHGGCMSNGKVDKPEGSVLVVGSGVGK